MVYLLLVQLIATLKADAHHRDLSIPMVPVGAWLESLLMRLYEYCNLEIDLCGWNLLLCDEFSTSLIKCILIPKRANEKHPPPCCGQPTLYAVYISSKNAYGNGAAIFTIAGLAVRMYLCGVQLSFTIYPVIHSEIHLVMIFTVPIL